MKTNKLFKDIVSMLSKEIDCTVIGGYAWETIITPTGSVDIDMMVMSKNYEKILDEVPNILNKYDIWADVKERDPIISLFSVRYRNETIEMEIVNSDYYNTKPFEFYDYVKQYRSVVKDNIRFANPELVWYMRLYLADWETYMYKCLREIIIIKQKKNVKFDLNKTLNAILDISRLFGTYKKMKPRVSELKRQAKKIL